MQEEELYQRKREMLSVHQSDPYPHKIDLGISIPRYQSCYQHILAGETLNDIVSLTGRVLHIREMGAITFVDIVQEHQYLQLCLRRKDCGEDYERFLQAVDRGDWICAQGNPQRTKKGELSLAVQNWSVACKAAKQIPFGKVEKYTNKSYGVVHDPEIVRRWPELAIATDPIAYATAVKRSKLMTAIRRYYEKHDFLEMAIPVIEREYGGASARPFMTRAHALGKNGAELPLRISHELSLKRLCVGGIPRVYHLGPAFRNEGIDADHHPEFLLAESYALNQDYYDVMNFFEDLIATVLKEVNGTTKVRYGKNVLDFQPPWKKQTLVDVLATVGGFDGSNARADEIMAQFEKEIEPYLVQPTIIHDYPWETTPLCKRHRDPLLADRFVERFEAFAVGSELANAYTELNDPFEQRKRMEAQAAERVQGNEETPPAPEEFLTSLDYGMPPLGGLGFGVDRLTMLAVGDLYPPEQPPRIQDVILFPMMTPLKR